MKLSTKELIFHEVLIKSSRCKGGTIFERYKNDRDDARSLRKSSTAYISKCAQHFSKPNSNGENVLEFFLSKIDGRGVYFLDELENSLSPSFQLKLMEFIELSAHCGIQFIIATHSPLLLGMKNAKILNLDEEGAPERQSDELENIQILQQFFAQKTRKRKQQHEIT